MLGLKCRETICVVLWEGKTSIEELLEDMTSDDMIEFTSIFLVVVERNFSLHRNILSDL
jgi:hypothetical protein